MEGQFQEKEDQFEAPRPVECKEGNGISDMCELPHCRTRGCPARFTKGDMK